MDHIRHVNRPMHGGSAGALLQLPHMAKTPVQVHMYLSSCSCACPYRPTEVCGNIATMALQHEHIASNLNSVLATIFVSRNYLLALNLATSITPSPSNVLKVCRDRWPHLLIILVAVAKVLELPPAIALVRTSVLQLPQWWLLPMVLYEDTGNKRKQDSMTAWQNRFVVTTVP